MEKIKELPVETFVWFSRDIQMLNTIIWPAFIEYVFMLTFSELTENFVCTDRCTEQHRKCFHILLRKIVALRTTQLHHQIFFELFCLQKPRH